MVEIFKKKFQSALNKQVRLDYLRPSFRKAETQCCKILKKEFKVCFSENTSYICQIKIIICLILSQIII